MKKTSKTGSLPLHTTTTQGGVGSPPSPLRVQAVVGTHSRIRQCQCVPLRSNPDGAALFQNASQRGQASSLGKSPKWVCACYNYLPWASGHWASLGHSAMSRDFAEKGTGHREAWMLQSHGEPESSQCCRQRQAVNRVPGPTPAGLLGARQTLHPSLPQNEGQLVTQGPADSWNWPEIGTVLL